MEGICSLMDYIRENFGESKGFTLSDLLMHVQGDYWVLNATYLFKTLLPVLFEKEETGEKGVGESQAQSLSEGIGNLLDSKSVRQNAKESILLALDEELQKGYRSVSSPELNISRLLIRSKASIFFEFQLLMVDCFEK